MYLRIDRLEKLLAKYQEKLEFYEKAEKQIVESGQSYTYTDGQTTRSLTSADLSFIAKQIEYYQSKVISEQDKIDAAKGEIPPQGTIFLG